MKKSRLLILFSIVMVLGVWAIGEMRVQSKALALGGIGPDVIVGDLPAVARWGTTDGKTGYSVATTSCNIGDEQLAWISTTNQHPVIGQNLYRVKDGRIEQLGQSWLKHGFFALSQSLCGSCQSTNGTALGIGCSDPYSASLNGDQGPTSGGTGGLGPRSQVNAATGVFTFPPRRLTSSQRGVLGGRIQVLNTDLDPALNSGAQYFVEGQYVQPQDAQTGNDDNNASYRKVAVSGSGSTFNLGVQGSTVRMEPAIHAWKAVYPDVELFNVDIEGDGRVVVGVLTTETGNGGYHTEIAIENMSSDRCVRSLGVECCFGTASNMGFNDVDYHAEDYSGDDWTPVVNGSELEWSTETFDQNQNANALRWGTMYSFWFDSDNPPALLTMGLFTPGTPAEETIELGKCDVIVGDVNMDGVVNLLDINPFVDLLSSGKYLAEADINGDGVVNLLDVAGFVKLLGGG